MIFLYIDEKQVAEDNVERISWLMKSGKQHSAYHELIKKSLSLKSIHMKV
jgi:hypothetical protein